MYLLKLNKGRKTVSINSVDTPMIGREGHILLSTTNGIIVGLGKNNMQLMNDFWLFDVQSLESKRIYTKRAIKADANVSMQRDDNNIYIMGGLNGTKMITEQKNWYKIDQLNGDQYKNQFGIIKVNGIMYTVGNRFVDEIKE